MSFLIICLSHPFSLFTSAILLVRGFSPLEFPQTEEKILGKVKDFRNVAFCSLSSLNKGVNQTAPLPLVAMTFQFRGWLRIQGRSTVQTEEGECHLRGIEMMRQVQFCFSRTLLTCKGHLNI